MDRREKKNHMELSTQVQHGTQGVLRGRMECKDTSTVSTGGMGRIQLPLALALLSHCIGVLFADTVLPNFICIQKVRNSRSFHFSAWFKFIFYILLLCEQHHSLVLALGLQTQESQSGRLKRSGERVM